MEEPNHPLFIAAKSGDVGFLDEALAQHGTDSSYFLPQKWLNHYNFLQYALEKGQDTFISQALQKLPVAVSLALICQITEHWGNLLHVAVEYDKMSVIELLVRFYKDNHDKIISSLFATQLEEGLARDSNQPPWLALDKSGYTPMHRALFYQREKIALYLASLDESLHTTVTELGYTPFCTALRHGCTQYVEKLLSSGLSYKVGDPNESNPLHFASNCSELIEGTSPHYKDSVLHCAVKSSKDALVELMLTKEDNFSRPWVKACRRLIWAKNNQGDTPLHVAASHSYTKIGKVIVAAYKSAPQEELEDLGRGSMGEQPWLLRNCTGETPLIRAFKKCHEEFACYILSVHCINNNDENPLYQFMIGSRGEVVKKILNSNFIRFTIDDHGKNFLHYVASKCMDYKYVHIEEVAKFTIQRFPHFIREKDQDGKTPLYDAAEVGGTWLVELLLKKDSSLIHYAPTAWIGACKNGHLQTILHFTQQCPDFIKVCEKIKDTPLHYVKLQYYREYKELLADPVIEELQNEVDSKGATPLHRAIERDDIKLAQILMTTKGVDQNIKDNNGITAIDLLEKYCDESDSWARMCYRINLNPKLKTSYLEPNSTNLVDMRGTLFVVATLLATISFAAGFTIPGGFDSNHGDAILGNNLAFEVFMLSNSFTMCCSMVVLFCLLWSMVSNWDKTLVLIDRSIFVLQLALCGTIIAFMTGVYAMLHKKSLWVSIVIIMMCSVVPISASRTILYCLIERFIPASSHGLIPQAGCSSKPLQRKRWKFKLFGRPRPGTESSRHGLIVQANPGTITIQESRRPNV